MIICNSYATVYESPDFLSQQTDEMLYGETAHILDEKDGFYKIKSEYGYEGWTLKINLFGDFHGCNYFVNSNFSDLLLEGKPKLSPYMSLPYGAKIKADFSDKLSDYAYVTHPNEHSFYIRKKHISPIISKPKTESELRNDIVSTAVKYLGVQYRWGGRTHMGIDCSGLCFNSYKFNGITIWRDSDFRKNKNLKKISPDAAKKGDLFFFKNHMALYLGDNKIIHATVKNGCVAIENLKENPCMEQFICAATAF